MKPNKPIHASTNGSTLCGVNVKSLLDQARRTKPKRKPSLKPLAKACGEITETLKNNGLTNREIQAWYKRRGIELSPGLFIPGWTAWRKENGVAKPWDTDSLIQAPPPAPPAL
jgi:hypothetical protein